MGCITTRSDVAGRLAQAGIPVWFMRQSYELVGSCGVIVNIVELMTPNGFSTENRPASVKLYKGLPGTNQLLVICRQGHVCADVEAIPLPQDYALGLDDSAPPPGGEVSPATGHASTSEGGPSQPDRPVSSRPVPCEYTDKQYKTM